MAAAQFHNGHPTYQLDWGQVGESHAISLARHLDLPKALIARATDLLQVQERKVGELVLELEELRAVVESKQKRMDRRLVELAEKEKELTLQKELFFRKKDQLENKEMEGFRQMLRKKETQIRSMIAALQNNPNSKNAVRAISEIRDIQTSVTPPEKKGFTPPKSIAVGDIVEHEQWGQGAIVKKVLKSGQYMLDIDGLSIQASKSEIVSANPTPNKKRSRKPFSIKVQPKKATDISGVRTDSNTCDLRGLRVDEAIGTAEKFLDDMLMGSHDVAFILHGHGTGALKKAIRQWLTTGSYTDSWRAANGKEGGDAFTIVKLV